MCYNFEVSLGTGIAAYILGYVLFQRNLTEKEIQIIIAFLIFSSMQFVDAILWFSKMKKDLLYKAIPNIGLYTQAESAILEKMIKASIGDIAVIQAKDLKKQLNLSHTAIYSSCRSRVGLLWKPV